MQRVPIGWSVICKKMNFEVTLWPTSGHPTIFASDMRAGPDKTDAFIYNHYDVQPIDPLQRVAVTNPLNPRFALERYMHAELKTNKGQCFYTHSCSQKQSPVSIKACQSTLSFALKAKRSVEVPDYQKFCYRSKGN